MRILLIAFSIIIPLCSAMDRKRPISTSSDKISLKKLACPQSFPALPHADHCVTDIMGDPIRPDAAASVPLPATPVIEYVPFPLHHAVTHNNAIQLEELLKAGPCEIDALDNTARSPLHHACEIGAVECAQVLLKRGASATQKCIMEASALHLAVFANNVDLITLLLKHSPQLITMQDLFKKTALHCAAYSSNIHTLYALLRGKPELNIQDVSGNTPLHLLLLRSTQYTSETELIDLVSTFIDLGADCTIQNNDGDTPLHVYVSTNNSPQPSIADLLCSKTQAIRNNAGHTWLDLARIRVGIQTRQPVVKPIG